MATKNEDIGPVTIKETQFRLNGSQKIYGPKGDRPKRSISIRKSKAKKDVGSESIYFGDDGVDIKEKTRSYGGDSEQPLIS